MPAGGHGDWHAAIFKYQQRYFPLLQHQKAASKSDMHFCKKTDGEWERENNFCVNDSSGWVAEFITWFGVQQVWNVGGGCKSDSKS